MLSVTSLMGCAERAPLTANDAVERTLREQRPVPACVTTSEQVEHREEPLLPESAFAEPEPAVTRRPGTRITESVSLGYAGDGKLTQIEPAPRLWGGEDQRPIVGYGGGFVYGGGGYGGYGHRTVHHGTMRGSSGGQTSGGGLHFSPVVHTSAWGGGKPGGPVGGGAGGSRPSGGHGRR